MHRLLSAITNASMFEHKVGDLDGQVKGKTVLILQRKKNNQGDKVEDVFFLPLIPFIKSFIVFAFIMK